MFFWEKIKNRFAVANRINDAQEDVEFVDFLAEIIGSRPIDPSLYYSAFVHRSAQVKDEEGNDINFERLEFLGDAVLGLIITVYVYEMSPDKQEGYLTKLRSKIVSRKQLNCIGKQMKLVARLHPAGNPNLGEDINGDLVEALIGAIYLDRGFEFASDFVFSKIIDQHIDLQKLERTVGSYKSLILEWAQKTKNKITFNTFEEENAEDLIVFVSVIRLNEKVISKGRGTSKKRAEENAAKRAFYSLQNKMENKV